MNNPNHVGSGSAENHESSNSRPEKTAWDDIGEKVPFNGGNNTEKSLEVDNSKREKEKPVGELTHEEASKEYLDTLLQLSGNFTSPEAIASDGVYKNGNRVGNGGYAIGGEMALEALKSVKSSKDSDLSATAGIFNKRRYALEIADQIIKFESEWRDATEGDGELISEKKQELQAQKDRISALEESYENSGKRHSQTSQDRFGKFLAKLKRYADRTKYDIKDAESETEFANSGLEMYLNYAYNEGHFANQHDASTPEQNEEYNNRFFTPEREPKIDRAIELRKKLAEDVEASKY